MNTTDIIDSRDLLKELRDLLEDSTYDYEDDPSDTDAWLALDSDDKERVEALRDVLGALPESTVDSLHGNSWGCTLVSEDSFTDYARELAEEVGAVSGDGQWPLSFIDWEAAADALKQDYTTVELDGTTYYAR